MNDEQMLFEAMIRLPDPKSDSPSMSRLREQFMKAGKQYTEFDIAASYRLEYAQVIVARWKRATMRS